MIARTWHGVVPKDKGDAYFEYLNQTGLPDYKAASGNSGIQVLKKEIDHQIHFFLISFWDSYESIKEFAGENYSKARYYPRDKDYLLQLEPFVNHYEVLANSKPGWINNKLFRLGKLYLENLSKLGITKEYVSIR